jgi:hypothetical protein
MRFEPDYDAKCDVCDQSPTVTIVEDGQTEYLGMCGPCTWGEAETLDPDTWNGDKV